MPRSAQIEEHAAHGTWFAQPCTNPCLSLIKQPRSQYIKWRRNEPRNACIVSGNESNSNDMTNTAALAEAVSMAVKMRDQYFGTSRHQSKIQAKATRESLFTENVYWERTNRDNSLNHDTIAWCEHRFMTKPSQKSAVLQRINDTWTRDSATYYILSITVPRTAAQVFHYGTKCLRDD